MTALDVLFVHTAQVETFLGAGPEGDTYAGPVTVKGFLDDGLVRQQTGFGETLLQKTVFYAGYEDAAKFTPETRVTVNGRKAQVVQVRPRDAGSLFAEVQHVEVDLT